MKRCLFTLIVIGVVCAIAGIVHADTTDSFEVFVTPNFYYEVEIDTGNAAVDFGNMAPSAVRYSTGPTAGAGLSGTITVKNIGNASADWEIMATEYESDVHWSLTANGGALDDVDMDECNLAGILTLDTTDVEEIEETDFEDEDIIDTTWRAMTTSNYCGADADYAEDADNAGDNVVASSMRILWLRMKAASDSTVTSQQKFKVEIRCGTSG
jgi:hypothetical protein